MKNRLRTLTPFGALRSIKDAFNFYVELFLFFSMKECNAGMLTTYTYGFGYVVTRQKWLYKQMMDNIYFFGWDSVRLHNMSAQSIKHISASVLQHI